ncbi:F-box only protein 33 [Phlebotomus argentipes]|uniref:F-box only protein 33 n=1 Tax=Phlebotomus argentipes TaxID=94469 RepID=UPI002892FFE6|nr:F-box only protein 33 [Phlebotomus argentipes]
MGWGKIPALALVEVYRYLEPPDRLQASATCKHWRQTLFHPRFFDRATFVVNRRNEARNAFYLQNLAHFISATSIIFDSSSAHAVQRAAEILLAICSVNERLVSLSLRPTQSQFALPRQFTTENFLHSGLIEPIKSLLGRRSPAIRHLNLGSCERLSMYCPEFLRALACPQELRLLAMASVKENPSFYYVGNLEASLFDKCSNLRLLSIDYDFLSDELLRVLQLLHLERIVLHIHAFDKTQSGSSDDAWRSFQDHSPQTELRINLIKASEAVKYLHSHILHESMPLSHMKVLFCKHMNPQAVDFISQNYNGSFKSLTWIDSSYDIQEAEFYFRTDQDPLVMMAWRCRKLEEIVVHGYLLDVHNLVGIARLRGKDLKRFEVAKFDLLPNPLLVSFLNEINRLMVGEWHPKKDKELPAALSSCSYPSECARDKYIMELTQKDIADFN